MPGAKARADYCHALFMLRVGMSASSERCHDAMAGMVRQKFRLRAAVAAKQREAVARPACLLNFSLNLAHVGQRASTAACSIAKLGQGHARSRRGVTPSATSRTAPFRRREGTPRRTRNLTSEHHSKHHTVEVLLITLVLLGPRIGAVLTNQSLRVCQLCQSACVLEPACWELQAKFAIVAWCFCTVRHCKLAAERFLGR